MNVILVCPEQVPNFRIYSRMAPLALIPVFGRSLLERALEKLATEENDSILVVGSDRPARIRAEIKKASIWGKTVRFLPTDSELSPSEAHLRFASEFPAGSAVKAMSLLDVLSSIRLDQIDFGLNLLNRNELTSEITMREVGKNRWISTRAKVHPSVTISGPCWIGAGVDIASGVEIKGGAVIETGAVIRKGVEINHSWVGPNTCVGEGVIISDSVVWGRGIAKTADLSVTEITDEFLLRDLCPETIEKASIVSAGFAGCLILLTLPIVACYATIRVLNKQPVYIRKRLILSQNESRSRLVRHFAGVSNVFARWPELFIVMKRDMALVGNRPLTFDGVSELAGNECHNWFKLPTGMISLADAEGINGDNPKDSLAYSAWFSAHHGAMQKMSIFIKGLVSPLFS